MLSLNRWRSLSRIRPFSSSISTLLSSTESTTHSSRSFLSCTQSTTDSRLAWLVLSSHASLYHVSSVWLPTAPTYTSTSFQTWSRMAWECKSQDWCQHCLLVSVLPSVCSSSAGQLDQTFTGLLPLLVLQSMVQPYLWSCSVSLYMVSSPRVYIMEQQLTCLYSTPLISTIRCIPFRWEWLPQICPCLWQYSLRPTTLPKSRCCERCQHSCWTFSHWHYRYLCSVEVWC